MAAPATIPRLAPVGFRLDNGHSTTIAFGLDTNIEFWEVETEAPAINGGDPIDTTTMHNATWRTKAPRTLKDLEPFTVVVAYDPNIYNSILVLINETEEVTIHFPDTSSLDFFGYIQSFDPPAILSVFSFSFLAALSVSLSTERANLSVSDIDFFNSDR